MIEVQSSRPYVKIDGDKYFLEPATARIAERLKVAQAVPLTYLMTAGKCDRRSALVHIYHLRRLVEDYGYAIERCNYSDTYTLKKVDTKIAS